MEDFKEHKIKLDSLRERQTSLEHSLSALGIMKGDPFADIMLKYVGDITKNR